MCQQVLCSLPSLNLSICTDQSPQLYKLVESRDVDIGLVSYQATFQHVDISFTFEQKMCVIRNCQEGTLNKVLHPSDLSAKDEIILNWGQRYWNWHNQWWEPNDHPHIVIDSMIMLRHLLRTPGSWAVVPRIDFPVNADLPLEICDLGEYNPPNRPIYLIEQHSGRPNRKTAVLEFKHALETFITDSPDLCLCSL